jgi:hypothetical protein
VSAFFGAIESRALLEVMPGEPSIEDSSVSVSPQTLPAGGKTAAFITVTVKDTFNNPVPDIEVTATSSRAEDSVWIPEREADESGVVTCRVSSQASGESVFSTSPGADVAGSTRLEFTPE